MDWKCVNQCLFNRKFTKHGLSQSKFDACNKVFGSARANVLVNGPFLDTQLQTLCSMLQHVATHGLLGDACSKVFGPARPRACKALLPEKALHGSHHGLGGFTTTYLEIRYSVHKLCQGCARLAESTLKHSLSLFPLADVVDGQNPHPHNGQNHYLTMDRTPTLQWVEFPRKKTESAWNGRAINLKVPDCITCIAIRTFGICTICLPVDFLLQTSHNFLALFC